MLILGATARVILLRHLCRAVCFDFALQVKCVFLFCSETRFLFFIDLAVIFVIYFCNIPRLDNILLFFVY